MVRLNNATVIVVNVGKSSGDVLEDGTTTELDASKRAVREFLQYQMLNRAKDEIAIVLCGCDETSNVLNQEDGESYKRLKVLGNVGALDRACTDIIKEMNSVVRGSTDEGDLIEALVLASHLFETRKTQGKNFRHRIVVITNGKSDCTFTNKDLESYITNGISNLCVRVDVVGIGKQFESDKLSRASEDLEKEFSGAEDKKEDGIDQDTKERTILSAPLVTFLSRVSKGVTTKVRTVADVVSGCEAPVNGTTTVFRGNLTIGSKISIGVHAFNKTTAQNLPTLKKESTQYEPEDGEDVADKDPKFAKVNMDREHRSSENHQEVPPEKRRNGYRYGADICVEDLTDKILFESTKEMELIGFVENKQVRRHHYMSKSIAICAEPGNDRAAAMLSALNHALRTLKCKAIVRFVKRNNTQPFLGCLDAGSSYLIFNQLPFAEDVRDFMFGKFEGDERFTPSEEQERAVDCLIDSLPMSENDLPMNRSHPVISRFYRCLHARYLDPKAKIVSEPDVVESAAIEPNLALLKTKKCSEALKTLKEEFKIYKRPADPTRGDRKRRRVNFWGDRDENSKTSEGDNSNTAASQDKLKLAGDSINNVSSSSNSTTTSSSIMNDLDFFGVSSETKVPSSVGSINPAKDFQAIARDARTRKDVTILKRASEELTTQAMNIFAKGSEVFLDKVVLCIKSLRDEATTFKESVICDHLNSFLRNVASSTDTKLWSILVKQRLHTLVGVSDAELREFLASSSKSATQECSSSTKEDDAMDQDDEEEEDLFDSMN